MTPVHLVLITGEPVLELFRLALLALVRIGDARHVERPLRNVDAALILDDVEVLEVVPEPMTLHPNLPDLDLLHPRVFSGGVLEDSVPVVG